MSTPLTDEQRTSLAQSLGLVGRLLACAEEVGMHESLEEQRRKIRDKLREIREMIADGRVDIESSDSVGRQAATDRNGIHINDTQDMFSMPGDMMLENCREGYFNSAWLIIAMLYHERYHYEHHTGVSGSIVKAFHLVFGTPSLMWTSWSGTTMRTWLYHEFTAYAHAYSVLNSLIWMLERVCREKPNCIPCCQQHLQAAQDAAARQNPWSNYGG